MAAVYRRAVVGDPGDRAQEARSLSGLKAGRETGRTGAELGGTGSASRRTAAGGTGDTWDDARARAGSETAPTALSDPASPAELAGRKTAPSLGACSFPLSKRGLAEAPMGSADTELGIPKLQKLGRSLRGDLKCGGRAVARRRSEIVLCLGAMSGGEGDRLALGVSLETARALQTWEAEAERVPGPRTASACPQLVLESFAHLILCRGSVLPR